MFSSSISKFVVHYFGYIEFWRIIGINTELVERIELLHDHGYYALYVDAKGWFPFICEYFVLSSDEAPKILIIFDSCEDVFGAILWYWTGDGHR